MPKDNNFQHAKYTRSNPGDRVAYLAFQEGHTYQSPEWCASMGEVSKRLREAGVRGMLFINGLPYGDLFGVGRLDEVGGLKRGYSRGIPGIESLLTLLRPETNDIVSASDTLKPPLVNSPEVQKQLDVLANDAGNFSSESMAMFQRAIDQHDQRERPLRLGRFVWSSQHHHFGRAKAAFDLIEFLERWAQELTVSANERLVVHAHGHAGQMLSLVSNLIAPGESSNRQILFQVLAAHYERTHDAEVTTDRLETLYRKLTEQPFLGGAALDVVTYGMPVRGGWETGGLGHLLHVVNHRTVRSDGKQWLAKMELPQIAWELPLVSGGDYVQQLAVAGTDSVPGLPQDELVNQELREIVEPYDGFERWLECARRGTRCQNDGSCLLVDYQVNGESSPRSHLFGHACYTEKRAMLFNMTELTNRLYYSESK
ncbi:MAG: hypothetical protein NPIRA02_26410 [Nitrospirales bacterium]|nr:MAG: hypothetical protein NPIRA02_26410 [Nitrospirales bacterium]